MGAAHEVEVGAGEDGDGDAGAGELGGDGVVAGAVDEAELGGVSDGDAAAPAVFLGLAADVFDLHAVGGFGEVQVHVDVDVEVAGDGEDAVDLAARVGVDIGDGADDLGAAAEAFDEEGFGAGVVEEAFLGKTQSSRSRAQA